MATMKEIEQAAVKFAEARAALVSVAIAFQDELNAVKKKHMPSLKTYVAAAQAGYAGLAALLKESPELFVKPRSVVFQGVKVGYQKAKGKIEWEDADQVVKLIKKHFGDQADVLIITKEKPAKEALEQLSAADLKRLGITVHDSGDAPFIKDTGAEVDKLVAAFLKDEIEPERNDEREREAA